MRTIQWEATVGRERFTGSFEVHDKERKQAIEEMVQDEIYKEVSYTWTYDEEKKTMVTDEDVAFQDALDMIKVPAPTDPHLKASEPTLHTPPVLNAHIMLDLETWDTEPTAAIISIGAVKFDPNSDEPMESFYVAIDPATSMRAGCSISASTLLWWMADERAAVRSAMLKEERVDLVSALYAFDEWYNQSLDATEEDRCDPRWREIPKSIPVWGNGANFDNVILRHAYKKTNLPCPFPYTKDRCYRTLCAIQGTPARDKSKIMHHALDDATAQALHLREVLMQFGLRL